MNRPEFALIDWIRARVVDRGCVKLGIGDDAAVLQPQPGRELLIATDMLMEGTDFLFPSATPRQVGRKALAVNISDIAAMGGRPLAAFVSVALPKERGIEFAREVHTGLLDLADEFDIVIAGGDTNSWNGPLVINVAIVGEPFQDYAITRAGARPDDWVFVTGSFGGSILEHHLNFQPRVRESQELVRLVNVHSMIDVSDGLAADLHHILEQSRVGAIIDADAIPISDVTSRSLDGKTPLEHALGDGEDFELIFTVAAEDGPGLISNWHDATPITRIGTITNGTGCWLRRSPDALEPLPPLGWTHALES